MTSHSDRMPEIKARPKLAWCEYTGANGEKLFAIKDRPILVPTSAEAIDRRLGEGASERIRLDEEWMRDAYEKMRAQAHDDGHMPIFHIGHHNPAEPFAQLPYGGLAVVTDLREIPNEGQSKLCLHAHQVDIPEHVWRRIYSLRYVSPEIKGPDYDRVYTIAMLESRSPEHPLPALALESEPGSADWVDSSWTDARAIALQAHGDTISFAGSVGATVGHLKPEVAMNKKSSSEADGAAIRLEDDAPNEEVAAAAESADAGEGGGEDNGGNESGGDPAPSPAGEADGDFPLLDDEMGDDGSMEIEDDDALQEPGMEAAPPALDPTMITAFQGLITAAISPLQQQMQQILSAVGGGTDPNMTAAQPAPGGAPPMPDNAQGIGMQAGGEMISLQAFEELKQSHEELRERYARLESKRLEETYTAKARETFLALQAEGRQIDVDAEVKGFMAQARQQRTIEGVESTLALQADSIRRNVPPRGGVHRVASLASRAQNLADDKDASIPEELSFLKEHMRDPGKRTIVLQAVARCDKSGIEDPAKIKEAVDRALVAAAPLQI